MSRRQFDFLLLGTSMAIALAIHPLGYSTLLMAQSEPVENKTTEAIRIRFIPANVPENPPPDNGTPDSDDGLGSRGDCIATPIPMTRLVGRAQLDLTLSSHPTFWIYVPYTPAQANSGVFSLQDEAGENEIWGTQFQLPATPGIVSITLPSTVTALETDKTYRWYFDLDCPRADSSNQLQAPTSVTGLVHRVSRPDVERQLNPQITPLKRASIYAENGLWYDAITEIAMLRLSEKSNPSLEQIWLDLLSDEIIRLNQISEEPIVGDVITSPPPK